MAVSQSQIVDLLYKQAFGVTKTDTATNKSPSNESIPSPLLIRGDTEWTQSNQIPATAAALSGIVQAYTGGSAVQCVADNTTVPIGGVYPTWKTNLTYWIPSEFGATYNVQVWVDNPGAGNPTLTGTQIFADGSGGTGQYYYNYQSGVLNFIGETIPAALTSGKVLYIVGYRYIGLVGVTNLPSNTAIGNLNFTGTTISSTNLNGNIILTPNGSGIVQVSSALTANGNITATYFIGNGSQLTGVAASNAASAGTVTDNAQPNITSVGTLISLDVSGNISGANANLGNTATANYFTGTLTTNAQPNITSVGTLTSLDVSGHMVANTFQMGYGVYAFYSTSVFFATTASTATDQVLWDYPAADLTSIDFTIIATDSTGSTRQSCKISATILGTSVAFTEYGGLYINGGVGSFSVLYNNSGPTPMLELTVTPDSSNLTEYNMLISKYLV